MPSEPYTGPGVHWSSVVVTILPGSIHRNSYIATFIVLNGPNIGHVARTLVNYVVLSTLPCIICYVFALGLLPYGSIMVSLLLQHTYRYFSWGYWAWRVETGILVSDLKALLASSRNYCGLPPLVLAAQTLLAPSSWVVYWNGSY